MSKAIEKKYQLGQKDFNETSIYIGNLHIDTSIMKRTKRTYPHPPPLAQQLQFS